MANDYQRINQSNSADGLPTLIAATATAGTLFHTATVDNTGNVEDEIWLWLSNTSTSSVLVTVEFGDATAPGSNIKILVPPQSGPVLAVPGWPLKNGKTVKAFAATTNVVNMIGYVTRITHA